MREDIYDKFQQALEEAIDNDTEEAFALISLAFVRMSEFLYMQQGGKQGESLNVFLEIANRAITIHAQEKGTVH